MFEQIVRERGAWSGCKPDARIADPSLEGLSGVFQRSDDRRSITWSLQRLRIQVDRVERKSPPTAIRE